MNIRTGTCVIRMIVCCTCGRTWISDECVHFVHEVIQSITNAEFQWNLPHGEIIHQERIAMNAKWLAHANGTAVMQRLNHSARVLPCTDADIDVVILEVVEGAEEVGICIVWEFVAIDAEAADALIAELYGEFGGVVEGDGIVLERGCVEDEA